MLIFNLFLAIIVFGFIPFSATILPFIGLNSYLFTWLFFKPKYCAHFTDTMVLNGYRFLFLTYPFNITSKFEVCHSDSQVACKQGMLK